MKDPQMSESSMNGLSMKELPYVALVALSLLTTNVQAHALWVNAVPAEPNKSQIIEMGYGDEFPSAENIALDRAHIFLPMQVIGEGGAKKLIAGEKNYQYFTEKPLEKGSYLVLATYQPTYWSQNVNGWKQESKTEMPDASYCQLASMYAKTILTVGDAGDLSLIRQPQGQKLEIVPMADPATVKVGQPFPVRVLYDGKAASNVTVTATFAGFGDKHTNHGHEHSHALAFSNKTDDRGRINIYPLKAGYWVAAVDYKTPFADKTKCDEIGIKSTLTFTIKE